MRFIKTTSIYFDTRNKQGTKKGNYGFLFDFMLTFIYWNLEQVGHVLLIINKDGQNIASLLFHSVYD